MKLLRNLLFFAFPNFLVNLTYEVLHRQRRYSSVVIALESSLSLFIYRKKLLSILVSVLSPVSSVTLVHPSYSGVTLVPPPYSGVTLVPPSYSGVTLVPPTYSGVTLVSLRCHSSVGVTPVSRVTSVLLRCLCHYGLQCHTGVIE